MNMLSFSNYKVQVSTPTFFPHLYAYDVSENGYHP